MVIDVSDILKYHGASKKIDFKEDINNIGKDTIKFISPVEFNGELINNGGTLIIKGILKTIIKVNCDRCLKEFDYNFNANIKEEFSSTENEETINLLVDNLISIDEIVKDNILLNLPMQFVCADDCKGLCYICGNDKNMIECNCQSEDIDPRFLKLKELLK